MNMATVTVLEEVRRWEKEAAGDWNLCFQYCKFNYDDGTFEYGYRFIWRDAEDKLHAARGQSRIPKVSDALYLISKAMEQGWGNKGEEVPIVDK